MHALIKGTIYVSPDVEPIRDGAVLIGGDKIMAVGRGVKVPTASEVIDCSGRTITAGFWNSHVHFFERKWANVAAIPAAELQPSSTTCSVDMDSPACSICRRCGRTRGGFAIASSPAK